ncbi:MAG TPA: aspartate 1-decarboxylase [Chthoniobacterales bacterium]|nr:aspartate 1-decarboxylase [Chthoniobacterales bacterium]
MHINLLKSKIHRASVTAASLDYEGSLSISSDIAETVELLPYERILVSNLENGERFETYVIYAAPGKGMIELNGATAHLGKVGDLLTIMNFGQFTPDEAKSHHPRIAVLDRHNKIIRRESGETPTSRREWEAEVSRK